MSPTLGAAAEEDVEFRVAHHHLLAQVVGTLRAESIRLDVGDGGPAVF